MPPKRGHQASRGTDARGKIRAFVETDDGLLPSSIRALEPALLADLCIASTAPVGAGVTRRLGVDPCHPDPQRIRTGHPSLP